jgi:hypothetical protein
MLPAMRGRRNWIGVVALSLASSALGACSLDLDAIRDRALPDEMDAGHQPDAASGGADGGPDADRRDAEVDTGVSADSGPEADAGPCPAGEDGDGDGVCDATDACLIGDDALDSNDNEVPDACDCDVVANADACTAMGASCEASKDGALCECPAGSGLVGDACVAGCGTPPMLEDAATGTMMTTGGTSVGATVSYRCNAGYYLSLGDGTPVPAAPTPAVPPQPVPPFESMFEYTCASNGWQQVGAPYALPVALECRSTCVDHVQMIRVSESVLEIKNTSTVADACSVRPAALIVEVHDAANLASRFSLADPTLAAQAALQSGDVLSIAGFAALDHSLLLCAAPECIAATVRDAVVWDDGSLPVGIGFAVPLRGEDTLNSAPTSGGLHRISSYGSAPTFMGCDWIVAGQAPAFADNFDCAGLSLEQWQDDGGANFGPTSNTPLLYGEGLRQDASTVGTGLFKTFEFQPSYISFWIAGSAGADTVFWACESSAGCAQASDTIFMVIYDNAGRVTLQYGSPISQNSTVVAPGVWSFVELRNINHVVGTFDYYLNGTLKGAFTFISTSGDLRIQLQQMGGGSGYWDEVRVW